MCCVAKEEKHEDKDCSFANDVFVCITVCPIYMPLADKL
jgi:hypothetical protein